MSSYLDVNTEAVANAGGNTAATSSEWRSLGSEVKRILNEATSAVHDAIVGGAVEDFGADWNPKVEQIAARVVALGTNTRTASNIVNNADADSATLLNNHAMATEGTGSNLRRPITA
jgi:uncharacterized protein YukE